MSTSTVLIAAFAGVTAVAALAVAVSAESRWGWDHPRQYEAPSRAYEQARAIGRDDRDDERQAFRLIRDDRPVAREDRFFARTDDGDITRGEQRYMNRQEYNVGARRP